MLLSALLLSLKTDPPPYFTAPAGREVARVVPGGTTVLPNGRFLTPGGRRLYTGEDLWHVLASPDGDTVVGFHDGGITVYRGLSDNPEKKFVPFKEIAPTGAFSRDGSRLVVSLGDAGKVAVLSAADWTVQKEIDLNVGGVKDAYLNDLVLSPNERTVYGVDVATQHLVTIDLEAGKVVSRVKAGRQPYAVSLNENGRALVVANIGIFDYSVVPKPEAGKGNPLGLTVPPFGFPSREAETGVVKEGRSIPGLGSPYVPDAQSVWQYDLSQPAAPRLVRQVKSGILIHAPADSGKAVGGSAPNALLQHGGRLYVSNANNDTLSVFEAKSLKPIRTIKLSPHPSMARLRGVIPSGMAMNRSGTRLYVCESGLNSIAVVDPKSGKTLGRIPTGWFPVTVRLVNGDRTLVVSTQKGLGLGPRGPLNPRPLSDDRHGLSDMPGMIQVVDVPVGNALAASSRQVLRNNGLIPATKPLAFPKVFPRQPGKASSQIEYVVFITKENHTFDGIFGGLKGANGEPEYAEFGMNGWIAEKGKQERLPIMPNHIRLAEQFAINDNFYMEPQASGDGHRWLVGVYPSLWTTRLFYAGWDFRATNDARGRLVSMGSNGSQIPEDYLENGSIWEHLDRNRITFRNYGEGYELPGSIEVEPNSRTGTNYQVNHPMPKVLFDNTCFDFPAYNNLIPDIARADWFVEDIENNFRKKGKPLPRFMNIAICNDHGDSPRPENGYPYVASYMADNDLALGKIVEYLSHQPEWKKMAIFVTQDDSGADNDHVDRHRSFALMISPWAKRGYISSDHTSIMSIIRSIYLLYGLGPNNMFDALATPLHDMFTDKPDFTPFRHVPVDPRVFRPEATFDPSDPDFKRRRSMKGVRMDDPSFVEGLRKRGRE
jgi:DNA-binding beta-propeller fold protein YncE